MWGSSEGSMKSALVSWGECCKSKKVGGLGLKKLVPRNQSFFNEISLSFYD